MVTTQKKIALGRSYLQSVWADIKEAEEDAMSPARNFPDRRLSVCHRGCGDTEAGRNPGRHKAGKSDGLLGSLLAETFVGAVFGPLLPLWAQAVDWSSLLEGVDEAWLDRRLPRASAAPARTPGISQVFVPL